MSEDHQLTRMYLYNVFSALPGLLNSAIPRVPTPQLTELSNLLGQTGTAAINNLASSLAATGGFARLLCRIYFNQMRKLLPDKLF